MTEQVPAPFDTLDPDTSPPLGVVRVRLAERVDPEAADALWSLILNPTPQPLPEPDRGGGR